MFSHPDSLRAHWFMRAVIADDPDMLVYRKYSISCPFLSPYVGLLRNSKTLYSDSNSLKSLFYESLGKSTDFFSQITLQSDSLPCCKKRPCRRGKQSHLVSEHGLLEGKGENCLFKSPEPRGELDAFCF